MLPVRRGVTIYGDLRLIKLLGAVAWWALEDAKRLMGCPPTEPPYNILFKSFEEAKDWYENREDHAWPAGKR